MSALPNAEIIAVGSEMLTPRKVDTNSLFLTGHLNALGVEVVRKTVVGDDRARLTETVAGAMGRTRIVLLSGGLGPTEDDLTREATADALGRKLVFDEAVCSWLEERFRRFGRTMAENNKRQAYVIEGAQILQNDWGTAPGQWLEAGGSTVVLLPGPPRELKALFEARCLPRLQEMVPPQVIRTRFLRVAGMGESDLDKLIAPVYTKYANPATTILAAAGDVQIHLRARCADAADAERLLDEVVAGLVPLLGSRLYSHGGETLEQVVGGLLTAKDLRVAVAESATGGLLGGRFTAVPGSSAYFLGGFLAYSDGMKTQLLGVSPELIAQHTAVSEPVAIAMAEGARVRTGADYALSITGYAGPEGNPAGLIFIGMAGPGGSESREVRFPWDRERIRNYACNSALDFLRKRLLAA